MEKMRHHIIYLACVMLAFPCLASAEAKESEDSAVMVAGITTNRSARLWYGLNAGGKLVSLYASGTGTEFSRCFARNASPEENEEVARLASDGKLFESPVNIYGPRELEMRPPGLALTRINLWQGEKVHEISISGLRHAPQPLQDFANKLKTLTEKGEVADIPAVIWCIDLNRTFGSDKMSYADLFRNKGKSFVKWKNDELIPPVQRVLDYPGTVEILDAKELHWLAHKLPEKESELFVDIDGRFFQIKRFLKSNSKPNGDHPHPHPH